MNNKDSQIEDEVVSMSSFIVGPKLIYYKNSNLESAKTYDQNKSKGKTMPGFLLGVALGLFLGFLFWLDFG